jgi:hypothetical protein
VLVGNVSQAIRQMGVLMLVGVLAVG